MIEYGFVKELSRTFEEACEALPDALQKEGFGVLTRIDMQQKLKEKLGVEISKYMIFGACNPPNAHKAVTLEENIGLMLPCNVVLYEKGGKTVLAIIKPTATMGMIQNDALQSVATEVEAKLKAVFDDFS